MSLKDIRNLGKLLAQFLSLFAGCFARPAGRALMAWNADELYGRDGHFLDGLDARNEAFVVEIPPKAHVWLSKPKVLRKPPKNRPGRPRRYPRLRRRDAKPSEVQNLAKYSPTFTDQNPQRYRIKDTHKGPEVWEIRWNTCWRKTHTNELVSRQCTLIVAKNVLTGEVKYFLSNRVPGRAGWNLRKVLRVAFGRWPADFEINVYSRRPVMRVVELNRTAYRFDG